MLLFIADETVFTLGIKKKSAGAYEKRSDGTMAERKGFEPLWGCPQTVFKTASL